MFDAKLLELISDLTPHRVYHPPRLVAYSRWPRWNGTTFLSSQHHEFQPGVLSILDPSLDHAHSMEALYDKLVVFKVPLRQEPVLNRVASRNGVYDPLDLQKYSSSLISEDIVHRSRNVADG